jgi:hypothetical protein
MKPPRYRRRNASGRDFTAILCDTLTDKAHLPVIPHILPQPKLKALLVPLWPHQSVTVNVSDCNGSDCSQAVTVIYLLTAVGLTPGGISTVHIYTQTIHRTTQKKQYMEQHKNFGRVRAVPGLCELDPGICFTTEEKAWKNLSQGSRRVPVATMKVHNHTIRIHRHNYKNT